MLEQKVHSNDAGLGANCIVIDKRSLVLSLLKLASLAISSECCPLWTTCWATFVCNTFCVFWILLMSGCHLEMDLWWSLCFLDGLYSFKQSAVWPDVGIKIAQFFQKLSKYWPQQFLLKICCPGFKAYAHYLRFYHL